MTEHILYKCKVCGCRFSINKLDLNHSKNEYRYLTCPLHGKHYAINVIGKKEIKELMEECKGVHM